LGGRIKWRNFKEETPRYPEAINMNLAE